MNLLWIIMLVMMHISLSCSSIPKNYKLVNGKMPELNQNNCAGMGLNTHFIFTLISIKIQI